jgi:hypothetical protein
MSTGLILFIGWDSSVGITTELRSWTVEVDSRQEQEIFIYSAVFTPVLGLTLPYPIGTGGSFK